VHVGDLAIVDVPRETSGSGQRAALFGFVAVYARRDRPSADENAREGSEDDDGIVVAMMSVDTVQR
jgi:hypothetical protein